MRAIGAFLHLVTDMQKKKKADELGQISKAHLSRFGNTITSTFNLMSYLLLYGRYRTIQIFECKQQFYRTATLEHTVGLIEFVIRLEARAVVNIV